MRLLLALLFLLPALPAWAAAMLDIDARDAGGVQRRLDPGRYAVSASTDGALSGWNLWAGLIAVCDESGADCKRGWSTGFALAIDEGEIAEAMMSPSPLGSGLYASPELALAAVPLASPLVFTVDSERMVRFFVADEDYTDNLGGVTLALTALPPLAAPPSVPEPQIWNLMLAGMGALSAAIRQRGGLPAPRHRDQRAGDRPRPV